MTDPRLARWGQGWTPPPRIGTGRAVAFALAAFFLPILLVGGCALVINVWLYPSLEQLMRTTLVVDLEVGQCFTGANRPTATGDALVIGVEVVDCEEPHEAEVIAAFDYPASGAQAPYPGVNEIAGYAERHCLDRFADYVGVPFERSSLEMAPFYPIEQGWRAGDRTIQCAVYPPRGEQTMTGSVRDSRR